MTAAGAAKSRGDRLSIGQVLDRLSADFDDLTLSKLRFLEDRGLVTPERTSSGYRKFSQTHIDRIRLVLTLQRDHYLPLKVIAEYLQDLDDGKSPEIPGAAAGTTSMLRPVTILNREEMMRQTGASPKLLADAISAGLLPAVEVFQADALEQLRSLVTLEQRGITPRHLRMMRVSVEREAELLHQAAQLRARPDASLNAREEALEMLEHLETVRSGMLRNTLVSNAR
ncbi:MerR family transcriptional regulator [Leucobacter sp. UCMA 4100]|uniref:transcriptional regulator FtsR n=1 Tax=Leucobacter sp. UCMA 4100 TaxID=2810534 RepID=UPI0022EB5D95|nr:MerR family transcriptional regulator [Leucobacter sp. UCMA 4100]MDA3148088.1 MerR family transcriptional regulator [Leucobacter sp. UCMA 4100]